MIAKYLAVAILMYCIGIPNVTAQNKIAFRLAKNTTLPHDSNATKAKRLGGISGIEYFSNDSMLLVSDHDGDGYSYAFTMNTASKITGASRFYGLKGVEAIRYNRFTKQLFYSFEKNKTTGVGYIEKGKAVELFSEPIPSANSTNNRGVEGIAIASDGSLWAAFESGGSTECDNSSLPFYRYPLHKGQYDTAKRTTYEYPFSRCSCSHGIFNGMMGNGVSEILAFKDDPNKLLVLERCFSGFQVHVLLFLATIPPTGNKIQKELLFNFNSNSKFDAANKSFAPDNLEGMAWGPLENGKRTLYMVSDNNYNYFQKNQVVKLVEE